LIRDFDDFGVIVVGDPRLKTKAYGRVFLDALPASPLLSDAALAARFLTERLGKVQLSPALAIASQVSQADS
jgi:ATP-dependent DNA helicase DinG